MTRRERGRACGRVGNPIPTIFASGASSRRDEHDDCGSIGANYGRLANNLLSTVRVVQLIKSQGIEQVKVYDTDPAVLKSLSGSRIKVTVDLPNELLLSAAKHQSFAYTWVQKNVAAYYPSTQIEAIAVSNEVLADPHNTTRFLVPAMKNIHEALVKYRLDSAIKVSSPIALSAQCSTKKSKSREVLVL
ncbi:glucan endo-1,3-beta-glucosidase 2-like [Actinidia eriantha]|uniref:glucan endo-1,3-beta-glucosidase 2-like n=1 Tax=Actinidia eriantha TaxID=165200 RepID=UPI002586267A|nr:glucan endo-1,3-beta-glucosidase 2-like [Actinidia eriantha]